MFLKPTLPEIPCCIPKKVHIWLNQKTYKTNSHIYIYIYCLKYIYIYIFFISLYVHTHVQCSHMVIIQKYIYAHELKKTKHINQVGDLKIKSSFQHEFVTMFPLKCWMSAASTKAGDTTSPAAYNTSIRSQRSRSKTYPNFLLVNLVWGQWV